MTGPGLQPMQLLAFKQRVLGVFLALRISAMMRQAGIAVNADALDLKHAATLNVETIGGSGRPTSGQQDVPACLFFRIFSLTLPTPPPFLLHPPPLHPPPF